ncbi:nucleoside hydrolase [Streptomyces antarcticus]|uniref:nucleoside hydrolase n=1 Tax=Streptomyces antarcticus TaxID=2996458 RepID=UPI002D1E3C99|nr:nucleoside hydrolase [Streptomyces sp. H34-AA3]
MSPGPPDDHNQIRSLALHYLFALPRVPHLITTVFGNTTAAISTEHARTLTRGHLLDVDVVHGCEKPLWWHTPVREEVRGIVAALPAATYVAALRTDNDGFWDADVADGSAPAVLAAALTRSESSDVLGIGPLTNIARALRGLGASGVARHRLWIAGGSIRSGNVTECAEFNAFADPEALQECLSAGWEAVVMVPLEVLQAPRLRPAAVDRIRRTGTPLGAALDRLERESPRGGSTDREPIWHVVAALIMADGTLPYEAEAGTISVDTDPVDRGAIRFEPGPGTHRRVTDIDPDTLVSRFEAAVSRPRRSP